MGGGAQPHTGRWSHGCQRRCPKQRAGGRGIYRKQLRAQSQGLYPRRELTGWRKGKEAGKRSMEDMAREKAREVQKEKLHKRPLG